MKVLKDMTNDEFDQLLAECMSEEFSCSIESSKRLLQIEGIYEVLSEYFNNEVIDRFEQSSDEDDEDDEDEDDRK